MIPHGNTAGYVIAHVDYPDPADVDQQPEIRLWPDVFPDVAAAVEEIHLRPDDGADNLFSRRVLALVSLDHFEGSP